MSLNAWRFLATLCGLALFNFTVYHLGLHIPEVHLSFTDMFTGSIAGVHCSNANCKMDNISSLPSPQRRFYIYDWPSNVSDSWPVGYTHQRQSIARRFRSNSGAGCAIDPAAAQYHTHQYSLYPLLYSRLLTSTLRTPHPEQAVLFFVPYDLGMDATTRSSDGGLVATGCPRLASVLNLLEESTYFKRNAGADHVLVHSINHMMLFFANKRCQQLYRRCLNCTKLSIDVYSDQVYSELRHLPHMTRRWVSVPFPSNYHTRANSQQHSLDRGASVPPPLLPPWMESTRYTRAEYFGYGDANEDSVLGTTGVYFKQRPHALALVGSVEVTARKQRILRQHLFRACRALAAAQPGACVAVELPSHDSAADSFLHMQRVQHNYSTVHTSADQSRSRVREPESGTETGTGSSHPYRTARLCLSPGGDFPTRKGLLDALLSGCVPVVFEDAAAVLQWPWHWRIPYPLRQHLALLSTHKESLSAPISAGNSGASAGTSGASGGTDTTTDRPSRALESVSKGRWEGGYLEGAAAAQECVVSVDREEAVRDPGGVLRHLLALSRDTSFLERKLRAIAAVGHRMQYALPPHSPHNPDNSHGPSDQDQGQGKSLSQDPQCPAVAAASAKPSHRRYQRMVPSVQRKSAVPVRASYLADALLEEAGGVDTKDAVDVILERLLALTAQ